MTAPLITGITAIALGTIALVLTFTEACRPRRNRALVTAALIVGGFVFGAGVLLTVQEVAAANEHAKVSVSGKADVSTPSKDVVR